MKRKVATVKASKSSQPATSQQLWCEQKIKRSHEENYGDMLKKKIIYLVKLSTYGKIMQVPDICFAI